jgi:hypothetical protein
MWIQECHKLYEEFVERVSGKRVAPGQLEKALSEARTNRRIGSEDLRIIEEGQDWPYPQWWPRLSTQFGEPLPLPEDNEEIVRSLQDRIRYIEVVSIVLRFVFPEKFGIISPPVIGLLNLAPIRDHEKQYLRYLSELENIRQHYEGLEGIADVDMALWVAAHLGWMERTIFEEMQRDQWFQETRLRNLMDGWYWESSDDARLTLAEILLQQDHDHVLAALIAARCFESKVLDMAARWKINVDDMRDGDGVLYTLVRKLMRTGAVPAGISLDELRMLRNHAVHKFKPPISKDEACNLVKEVRRLWSVQTLHPTSAKIPNATSAKSPR